MESLNCDSFIWFGIRRFFAVRAVICVNLWPPLVIHEKRIQMIKIKIKRINNTACKIIKSFFDWNLYMTVTACSEWYAYYIRYFTFFLFSISYYCPHALYLQIYVFFTKDIKQCLYIHWFCIIPEGIFSWNYDIQRYL